MQRGDLRSVSDGELVKICALTPLENALQGAGCLASAILLVFLFVSPLAGLFLPALLGTVLAVASAFWLLHAAGRPKRAYRQELAWRRGRAPFRDYVDEARRVLDWNGADWIILFTIASLPNGSFRWLRLTFTDGPPVRARVRLRISQPGLPDRRADGDLPDAALQDLLAMLKAPDLLDLAALTSIPEVFDGAPCQLAILRREPESVATGSCNLGGAIDDLRELPAVAACLKLASIAHGLAPEG